MSRFVPHVLPCLIAVTALSTACSRPAPVARQYELIGQVLAVRPADREIVIKHQDIENFMPGMTMPFKVRDQKWLDAARPGDFVTATLVVEDGSAYLSRVTPTGEHRPVPADAAVPRVMLPPLNPGEAVPDARLVAQTGRPFALAQLKGSPYVMTFTYTRCPLPTFCPLIDKQFQTLQERIRKDAALHGTRLVSVSIDPAHDTPEVLREHAGRLGADASIWTLLTGPVSDVDRLGERFGLVVDRGDGTPETLVHSLRTVVVNADGRVVQVFEGTTWTPGDIVRALETMRS
jgi:protein SCO1